MSMQNRDIPVRVLAIDAFRGFVLFLMMAEVLHLYGVAKHFPEPGFWHDFWERVRFHTTHVEWGGCSLHDLIQPAFSFLVGVSLPFSIANREARGQSRWIMLWHAVWRAFLLIALGIFLRSIGRPQTNFTFTDTLGQIGLGYVFLFLLGLCWQRVQWAAFVFILVGYWAFFAFWPLPNAEFDYQDVGVTQGWRELHSYDGFLAHWNKNTNPASEFDVWWLNQFPRAAEFRFEGGGYATLSFIPTLATMILGLIAGGWLRQPWTPLAKFGPFLLVGIIGLALGLALEYFEICPIIKRIWTPAWVLYSGGWTFVLLAGFYFVIEIIGFWHWSFPLLVLGANSIVAYCSNNVFRRFITENLTTHANTFKPYMDTEVFNVFGDAWVTPLTGAAVLLILWLMLFWMYRNKIFVRI